MKAFRNGSSEVTRQDVMMKEDSQVLKWNPQGTTLTLLLFPTKIHREHDDSCMILCGGHGFIPLVDRVVSRVCQLVFTGV